MNIPLLESLIKRPYRICLLFLSTTLNSPGQPASLDESTEIANTGVYLSQWMGVYSRSEINSSWIFSDMMGWVYFYETENSDSLWLFHPEINGWVWTTPTRYPYAYHINDGWIYFHREDPFSYYYHFETSAWYTLEKSWHSPVISREERASRFLSQATFGADYELIQTVAATGPEAWINQQFNQPITSLESISDRLFFSDENSNEEIDAHSIVFRAPWWEAVLVGSDPLRHRITQALSEIFVISDGGELEDHPLGLVSYYDMLQRNAFGNLRQVLYDVTIHPCVGLFLSHAGNRPPDPSTGRFPDENYARELMQLFTIGLYELNMDGSLRLDTNGNPIPTYNNNDITEFARVFTGMHYDVRPIIEGEDEFVNEITDEVTRGTFTIDDITFDHINDFFLLNFQDNLYFYEREHDTDEKSLLNGTILPSGQSIQQDLDGALDNLFNHPNTPPFISRLLIQRLVKSNPSPAYINRIANAFVDNGNGIRGDMKAIISAILLDVEARSPDILNYAPTGKMREPFFKLVHYLRAFNARPNGDGYYLWDREYLESFNQRPYSSPSVFNFYLPDYSPSGPIGDAGLTAPEFQIVNSFSLSAGMNLMFDTILENQIQTDFFDPDEEEADSPLRAEYFPEWSIDLLDELALSNNLNALINRLDLILTHGQLTEESKSIIRTGLQRAASLDGVDKEAQVRLAIYLILISPDYNILR